MPRKHKRQLGSRKYHDFSLEKLSAAVSSVKKKEMTLREAAQVYGVPKSTINRHVKGICSKNYGRPPALSEQDEIKLTRGLITMGDWGFPLTPLDIRCVVKKYLDKRGIREPRFKNNMPGKEWVKSFLNRKCDELKVRLSENIKRDRAAVNRDMIKNYFSELKISMEGVLPQSVLNYDETNMSDDPGKQKVIVRRNCKHPEKIMDNSKSSTSVMFCGSASGNILPPYVVYRSENLYNTWLEGGPAGTRYSRSKSGWFEGPLFEDWFFSIALPYLKNQEDGPKVIIGDNLSSHISIRVIEACEENNIRFILLPPNSTHLSQPLDLAFFRPLKIKWRQTLHQWKSKNRGSIPKDTFPRLLKQTLQKMEGDIPANLKSGFEASGIYPVDENKILSRLPKENKDHEEDQQSWNQSLTDFLKETRSSETKKIRKKERILVEPGKSLSADILRERIQSKNKLKESKKKNTNNIQKKKQNEIELIEDEVNRTSPIPGPSGIKKLKFHRDESSDSESLENFSLHDSTSDAPEEFSDYEDNNENVTPDPKSSENSHIYKIGDFICASFKYDQGSKKESQKKFVGKIISKTEKTLTCKFLRNYTGSIFSYPIIDDISELDISQILEPVYPKKLSRERYYLPNY